MTNLAISAGAAYYSRVSLYIYDFWVLYVSCTFAWLCSTRNIILPFFRTNVGRQHLDIGVGTGFFPSRANKDKIDQLTLVDLNPNCLSVASKRFTNPPRNGVEAYVSDTLQPEILPVEMRRSFDSVSLMYLLHTLPGPPENKARVFGYVRPYVKKDGVVFGATILGRGVCHNWFGKLLMWVYNWTGIFDNWDDGREEFLKVMEAEFERVEAKVIGCVLVFVASQPRDMDAE
ncbi:hypothetical protein AJ79_03779 [Helicocarpus griseus UAMH5409]|uniref:Methyltransferase type 11 domain-containing protein n=1 Tax=Helicocarpus griseus UAMH5409 TaxID=1447875 RepID=A0A2B7XWS3_9EURO|nr:hypothetical protein AJ79_03779 [Helicocarpus griseus UAMH5409]